MTALLPPATIARLQRGGKRYAKAAKRIDRLQWFFGALVNQLWDRLPDDAREELRMSDWYAECSYHINSGAGYRVIGESGETLRVWCAIVVEFTEPMYGLSFDHHRVARSIGGDPTNILTAPEVLNLAHQHNWTADEIRPALNLQKATDPQILEIRSRFAPWWGHVPDMLIGLNGRRAEAEAHLKAVELIVESERK